jgi:hypothetical protein
MLHFLQILTITLVAVAMAPAVAHALEFPGKKRLNRDAYVTVQSIYYPGFTLLGVSEPAGLIATFMLLLFTPRETTAFWLTLIALFGLLGMQVIYWMLVHPTNKYWLQSGSVTLGNVGGGFFAFDPTGRTGHSGEVDWTKFRDRWEHSHIARAGLAFLSFLSLVLATVIQD